MLYSAKGLGLVPHPCSVVLDVFMCGGEMSKQPKRSVEVGSAPVRNGEMTDRLSSKGSWGRLGLPFSTMASPVSWPADGITLRLLAATLLRNRTENVPCAWPERSWFGWGLQDVLSV